MRVLMVQHRGDAITGGVEQWLLRVAKYFPAHGVQLYVALPEAGPLQAALASLAVPTKILDLDWQPRTQVGWSRYILGLSDRVGVLAEWIQSERIDLVHSNTQYLLEGALAALRGGCPHVWHLRSAYDLDPLPYAFGGLGLDFPSQTQWLTWLTDGLLSVSGAAARVFLEHGHPVKILPNGLDIATYANPPTQGSLRAELGWPEDTPLVACIARVSPEKDLPTFVRVCHNLREAMPRARFLIIGNTDEHPGTLNELNNAIAANGLQDSLRLLGQRHDLPTLYRQLDLVMLTSLHEGQPNVLMEAMASGVPVVATRCGGPEKLIDHAAHGLLADVGDVPGLTMAALRCLQDRPWAQTLARAGQERITRDFSLDGQLEELHGYYATLRAQYDSHSKHRLRALADAALAFATQHGHMHLTLLDQEKRIRILEQGRSNTKLLGHLRQIFRHRPGKE